MTSEPGHLALPGNRLVGVCLVTVLLIPLFGRRPDAAGVFFKRETGRPSREGLIPDASLSVTALWAQRQANVKTLAI